MKTFSSSTQQSAPTLKRSLYLSNLERYIADGKKEDVLYDHQKKIINDTVSFLKDGGRRGYIESPTGTGKTVLFVTLAEAFSYQAERPPKILVVTPTKDLVRQTQGGTRGDRGFAGFAPHMEVGTFYSDTPSGMRGLDAQVTITTYASLAKLAATRVTTTDKSGVRHTVLKNLVDGHFDIIFLDEGHKALGTKSRHVISEINPETIIIGFTATPVYHASRSLESLLPTLIHRLDLKEAIQLDMLSSIIPVAVPAPKTMAQEFVLSTVGEYENSSLKQLIYETSRNEMVVSIAARLIDAGNTPIIACIPGDDMAHPNRIADMLTDQFKSDGRRIRARVITSAIPASARQKIYDELERGEVDALTYIDVLTEGWDSQRANVIINARPTRSLVAARQRMGRILRNKPDSRPALAIDIVDTISQNTAPQVSMADIFSVDTMTNGAAIGTIDEAHTSSVQDSINSIFDNFGTIKMIENNYTKYAEMLEMLPNLTRGQATIKQNGKVRTFASPGRLFNRLAIDSFALDYILKHFDIETRLVRRYHEAVEAYDEDQIQANLAKLPDAVHTGQGLKVGDISYVSLTELMAIIRRKYVFADPTYKDVEEYAHEAVRSDSDVYFTKRFRARTHRGVVLYTAQTMVSLAVGQTIVAEFRNR